MTLKEILDKIPIPPLKDCGEILDDKFYRLKSFFYSLSIAEPTGNAEDTINLINSTLIYIENCHSGVEAVENPELDVKDRMYPIQDDYIYRKENGAITAFSKGNKILIEPNGEFRILSRKNDELILERLW